MHGVLVLLIEIEGLTLKSGNLGNLGKNNLIATLPKFKFVLPEISMNGLDHLGFLDSLSKVQFLHRD